jgi:hypothetical protein
MSEFIVMLASVVSKTFVIMFSALLWAEGGKSNKNIRRIGVPLVCLFYVCFTTKMFNPWFAVSALLLYASTTIGYGIPDDTDEGSPLGIFWMNLVSEKVTNVYEARKVTAMLTRITCAFAYSLSLLFWANTIYGYLLSVALIVGIVTVVTVMDKNPPEIIQGLSTEELIIGASIGGGVILCLL